MHEEDSEIVGIIRRQNKILRKVNQALRSTIKYYKNYADELFLIICESKNQDQNEDE